MPWKVIRASNLLNVGMVQCQTIRDEDDGGWEPFHVSEHWIYLRRFVAEPEGLAQVPNPSLPQPCATGKDGMPGALGSDAGDGALGVFRHDERRAADEREALSSRLVERPREVSEDDITKALELLFNRCVGKKELVGDIFYRVGMRKILETWRA